MNRNMAYEILKEKGMYPTFQGSQKSSKLNYHARFVPNIDLEQVGCFIEFDWGYVRHITEIHLCTDEMVLIGRFPNMKVNVSYSKIDKFDVRIEYEE